ncbi:protein kinase [Streptomyces sp. p1417]|uniref:Protein kinase n=1 Tax=Streptomyces typhae TaxID=2681492 RepID=A0A6L6X931_9ACTN|nr:serine/threonine-protein kinase [Streptomyces typhae]MVO89869.1 protein kinase [Streptomyces typhae]
MIGQLRESSPRRIGPYETLARLGAGGMGEVFLAAPANDRGAGGPRPESLVAVKAIRGDLTGDAAFRARFRREITVATAVTSPWVARVVAGDPDAEQPWLATEYVAGPTLAEAVRGDGPLPPDTVAALGADLARALAAVHAAGAMHRDLKPANVLLGADGPKLIDFGVARVRNATTMTTTGVVVGTPGFMSPEHIAGGRHVVAASDVFCLASVLAHAASGHDPFGDAPLAAVLYRVSRAEHRLDDVPEELREVLAECLVAAPEERPAPEDLARRLAARAGRRRPAADDGGDGFPWPARITATIAEADREVARLCANGLPLLPVAAVAPPPRTPTAPGTPPQDLHGMRTMGAVSPPPTAPAAGRAPRRGRLVAAIVAVALVGAGVGALLALRGGEGAEGDAAGPAASTPGHPDRRKDEPAGTPPKGSLSKKELKALAGVDEHGGADRSGTVPQLAAQRPDGWKQWRGRFGHAPLHCAADAEAVVCLLTDGTYEALGAADGSRLWTADGGGGDTGGEAYISPSGGLFMPGDSLEPQLRGGTAVIAHKGRLQARDSRTGAVRWTAPAERGQFIGKPVLHGDLVVVGDQVPLFDDAGEPGVSVTAYGLRDGARRWSTPTLAEELAKAEDGAYTPGFVRDGLVYATTRDAVVALDARDGAERARNGGLPGGGCRSLMARGKEVLCVGAVGGSSDLDAPTDEPQLRVSRLDPRTLQETGGFGIEATQEESSGMRVSAVGAKAAVIQSRETQKLLVADPGDGEVLRETSQRYAPGRPVQGEAMPRLVSSGPLLVDDGWALYADNSRLVSVPVTAAGAERAVRVPGAPGDRQEPAGDSADGGTVIADSLRAPVVLALGGVAHVVYDEGTVASVAVPPGP